MSPWDPPMAHYPDGSTAIVDYDPGYTPPYTWPIIGPIMILMCLFSVNLLILPPTAFVVAAKQFLMAIRLNNVLKVGQKLYVWTAWSIGVLCILYLLFWGRYIADWFLD